MPRFGSYKLARPSGTLAVRLCAFMCVLTAPVVVLTTRANAKLDAEIARFRTERAAVRWIASADRFINAVEAEGTAWSARVPGRGTAVGARLAQLDRDAAGVPAAAAGTARIRRAWVAQARAPGGRALALLVTETGAAIDDVSDASELSFESHIFVADLGDVLDNSYYRVFAPLGAAAATMQGGTVRPQDGFRIAGQIAVARQFHGPLANDMDGALEQEPKTNRTLRPAWNGALAAAQALERDLSTTIERRETGVARVLSGERTTLAKRTEAFTEASQRATEAGFLDLEAQDRREQWRNLMLLALAFALVAALGGVVVVVISRRDRRELERAQRDAAALAAELARQQAERARILTEAQFDAVFDRSQMGIALLDASGAVVECNPALRSMLGTTTPLIVEPNDPHFAALCAGNSSTYQHETALVSAEGKPRWAQVTISSVDVADEPVAAIAMVQDISERKGIEERLRYAASHDDLTSLLNRTQFLGRLAGVLSDHAAARRYAVLFIDLDRFKLINDTLGHPAGDRAITITAERLLATTRPDDVLARLHGDEFAVLLCNGGDPTDARVAAERINEHLIAPIQFGDTSFGLTASIGIVAGLDRYRSAEHVMRDADVAMYHAKRLGRSNAVLFDGQMSEQLSAQMRILTDLRTALPRDEIYVAYQPIVSLRTSETLAFEALLRWKSPKLGEVSPGAFIPVAEESDAIHELGHFALTEACNLVARLDGAGTPPLCASVNLSVSQLIKGDIAAQVRAAVRDAGITPDRLILEITESGLLENKARAHGALDELHRFGVQLCIDDFGTGYSSLRYLHEFPVDILKIDRSFINGPQGGLANAAIVEMLLSLVRHLGVKAVAEGIETETQRAALREAGCEAAQGYFFARPLAEEQFIAWLRANEQLRDAARVVKAS